MISPRCALAVVLATVPACSDDPARFSSDAAADVRFDAPTLDLAPDAAALDAPPDRSDGVASDTALDTPPLPDASPEDIAPVDLGPPPPPADVEVVITADNAYSFGYGDGASIATFFMGTRARLASEIFACPVGNGPERYVVPGASAPDSAYLYVVSWDDLSVTQGVIGQFRRGATGAPIYTGAGEWEVCATGIDLSRSMVGPTQAEVNGEITRCNAGAGDAQTSRGWVNLAGAVTAGAVGTLAVGEMNDANEGDFQLVCGAAMGGVDVAARWMWYQPGGVENPFRSTGSNVFHAYLIFRLRVGNIPSLTHG